MKTKKIIKGSGDEIGQKRQDVTVNPTVAEYTHMLQYSALQYVEGYFKCFEFDLLFRKWEGEIEAYA